MSAAEDAFALLVRAADLPTPEREYKFAGAIGRRWRSDFAWPDAMLLVEIEGGVYSGGRHVRGAGYTKDCVKYNSAAMLGWRLLRFTPGMLDDAQSVTDILVKALGGSDGND